LETNETKVLRKILGKTKIYSIRSQQNRESCSIQPIEWVERGRECDEHVTRIDERLVKISRDNMPAGRSSRHLKRRWRNLIPG
jgi:hypothetical protein